MRPPINWARIDCAATRGILHARKSASQKLLRRFGVIPPTGEIILIGVKPAAKAARTRRRSRQKQICIFGISEIGFGKKRKIFIRSHPEIVRSAKGGHFAFHTKKNFLRLRR
jgi:hypothetical protein